MCGLNCRPGQWAWIDIPRTPENIALGLVQLQGRVVRTERLMLHPRLALPTWVVTPEQCVQVVGPLPAQCPLQPGEVMDCVSIPDAWLRPLEGFSDEELQVQAEELTP